MKKEQNGLRKLSQTRERNTRGAQCQANLVKRECPEGSMVANSAMTSRRMRMEKKPQVGSGEANGNFGEATCSSVMKLEVRFYRGGRVKTLTRRKRP